MCVAGLSMRTHMHKRVQTLSRAMTVWSCSVLRCGVAVCCGVVLQFVAVHCRRILRHSPSSLAAVLASYTHHPPVSSRRTTARAMTAQSCIVLQCVGAEGMELQRVAVRCCSALQYAAAECCSAYHPHMPVRARQTSRAITAQCGAVYRYTMCRCVSDGPRCASA